MVGKLSRMVGKLSRVVRILSGMSGSVRESIQDVWEW